MRAIWTRPPFDGSTGVHSMAGMLTIARIEQPVR